MMKRIVSMLLCLLMVVGLAAPSVMAAPSGDMGTDDIYFGEGSNVVYNKDGSVTVGGTDADSDTPTQRPQAQTSMELQGHAVAASGDVTVDAVGVPQGSSLQITEADPARAQIAQQMAANRVGSEKALYTADISVKDKSGLDWQPNGKVRLELDVPNAEEARGKELYVVHVDDDGHANYIDAQLTDAGTVVFETDGFSVFHLVLQGSYTTHNMPSDHHTFVLSVVNKVFNKSHKESDISTVTSSNENVVKATQELDLDGQWELVTGDYTTATANLTVTMTDGTQYVISVSHELKKAKYRVGSGAYTEDSNALLSWYLTSDYGYAYVDSGDMSDYAPGWSSTSVVEICGPGVFEIKLQECNNAGSYYGEADRDLKLDLRQIKVTNGATLYISIGGSVEASDTITIYGTGNCPVFLVEDGSLHIRQTDPDRLAPEDAFGGDFWASGKPSSNCSVDWPRDWYDTNYGRDNADDFVPLTIDGSGRGDSTTSALIHLTDGADNLYIEDVVFQNARLRAILVQADRMDDIILKNCVFMATVRTVNWQGGAIYVGGTSSEDKMVDIYNFVLDDCYFRGNNAEDDGGALYLAGRFPGEVKINNCVFYGCHADEIDPSATEDYAAHGGAVYMGGAIKTVTITDTLFEECKTESYGGAIAFASIANKNGNYNRIDDITISNCTFKNCISLEKHGGAISFKSQTQNIKIMGCEFNGCHAKVNGGAITFNYTDLGVSFNQDPKRDDTTGAILKDANGNNLTGASWSSNTGNSNTRYREWPSGTYTQYPDVPRTMKRTTIGKVLIDGLYDADGKLLKRTQFLNCMADSSGGAFEFAHSATTYDADVNNVLVDGCKAVNNGNGIFLSTTIVQNLDITNSEFRNCDNIKTTNANGTGVTQTISVVVADSTTMSYQLLKDEGTVDIASGEAAGTIRSTGEATCQFYMGNTILHDNRSRWSGGGLYWNALNGRDIWQTNTAEVENCEFYNNTALQDGGGIYCEATLIVKNTRIYNNTAFDEGGGIAQQVYNNPGRPMLDGEATDLTLDPSTQIYGNTAKNGGGISIKANASQSITNHKADGTYMDPDDPAFVQHSVTFRLGGATIRDNDAKQNGGGVYFLAETYDPASTNAHGDTGANSNAEVQSYIKSITIDEGLIYNNESGMDSSATYIGGGGIFMSSSQNTTLLVSGGHIYKNTAHFGNGGGIYMTGEGALCTITGGTIGGIIEEYGKVKGYETSPVGTLLSNVAQRYVAHDSGIQGRGGGIALAGGAQIEMRRPYLVNDQGQYVNEKNEVVTTPVEDVTKAGGEVSFNVANFQGGGIWLETTEYGAAYHCDISITGGTIKKNKVEVVGPSDKAWGGGIYLGEFNNITMYGGTVEYNTAPSGGGICLQRMDTATIYGGSIKNNTATDQGGGCFIRTGSVLTMHGGDITENTAKNGGGIYLHNSAHASILTSDDSTAIIEGNIATGDGGGAYVESMACTLTVDGKIIGNKASGTTNSDGSVTGGCGGGVYLLGNCTLNVKGYIGEEGKANTAVKDGGGICAYASGNGSPKVEIVGTVQHNYAEVYGGGIYAYIADSAKKLTVSGTIQHNSTNGYGGGVYATSTNTLVEVTGDILNNTAAIGGGAAVLYSAQIEVKGGSVSYNTTTNGGAGIYASGASTVKLTVDGTKRGLVSYNTSKNFGGAGIYAQDDGTKITVAGDIMYNHALMTTYAGQGGGIYMVGGVEAEINGTVSHNDATSNGGGIYASGANELTVNGTVSDNETTINGVGGGIFADGTNTVDVYGTIIRNTAKSNGGGVAIRGGGTLTVTGGNVESNTAEAGGGGIHCYGATVTVNSGNIKGNHAAQFAGGMYIGGASTATVDGDVLNNTTDGNGGGIHCAADSVGAPTLGIQGNVQGNKAANHGGGVYAKKMDDATGVPSVTITNGNIQENHANCAYDAQNELQPKASKNWGNGGGVYLEGATLTLTGQQRADGYFDNGMIKGNSAVNGGGVYAVDSVVSVTGGIRDNEAKYVASGTQTGVMGLGGGLYAYSSKGTSSITLEGNIAYNEAQESGGGIYLEGSGTPTVTGDGTVYKVNFTQTAGYIFDNEALDGDGGGILVKGNASADIQGGIIRQNKAVNGYGGGINAVNGGNVTVSGGSVMVNVAKYGGGIAAEASGTAATNVTVSGGSVTQNNALYGGGIYANGAAATVIVRGGSVIDNQARSDYAAPGNTSADGYGGGVYVNGGTVQVNRPDQSTAAGSVENNKAGQGGGVYVTGGGDLTVMGGYIIENYAYGNGGVSGTAKYTGEDLAKVMGIGGGIFISDGTDGNNSTFTLLGKDEAGNTSPVAIYNNIADYAADDVYANGNNTKLSVPKVSSMDLEKYEFPADCWVEDYAISDPSYHEGMNGLQMAAGGDHSIIVRYRGSSMDQRVPVIEVGINEALLAPNIEDTYVCMTLGVPGIVSDKVIIDHGLYVDIDVMNNDRFSNQDSVKHLYIGPYSKDIPEFSKNTPSTFSDKFVSVGSYTGEYGKLELLDSDMLRYQLGNMSMPAHDQFCYAVEYQIGDDTYYYYAAVTVIPATTIYFEENFSDAISFQEKQNNSDPTNGWTTVGIPVEKGQDMDRVTLTDEDLDIVYGYDSSYVGSYKYSMGAAMKTTVWTHKNALTNVVEDQKIATATFRFTGTGFDVVSMTSNKTGTLMVNVFELEEKNGLLVRKDSYDSSIEFGGTDTVVNPLKTLMVDTYYGYTYENGEWKVTSSDDEKALYQIPVINVYGLEHGMYEVELYVAYNVWFGHDQYKDQNGVIPQYDFYLDGIRIYDPVKDPGSVIIDTEKVTDAEGNETTQNITIQDVYLHHGEAYPTYHELRDLLLPTNDAEKIGTLVKDISLLDINIRSEKDAAKKQQLQVQRDQKKQELDALINGSFADAGAVYIDGSKGSLTIGDMGFYGPNNEVYLNKGGAVVTTLSAAGLDSVYLGLKSIKGDAGTIKISGTKNGTPYETTIKVASGTDMFYDISGMTNLTIQNASTSDVVIAITNVKVTYTADPYGGSGAMESDPFGTDVGYLSSALLTLTGDELADTEPSTDPELTLQYPSLSFEDEIFYNVYFTAGDITDVVEMGLMILPSMMADGTVDDAVAMIPGYLTNGAVYMARTNGIPAAQMGDTVYFRVYAKLSDGSYVYSTAGGYNAKAYANTILNGDYAETMDQLVVAMLTYGAEAQRFFGHNTESLMDSGLTAEQKALIAGYDSTMMDDVVKADSAKTGLFVRDDSNFKELYPSVSFDGAFAINYYCMPAIPVDDGMRLYWWDAEAYASVEELTLENASGSMDMELNDKYWGQVSGIAAKDMDKTYYVTCVFESEGETVTSGIIAYSLGAYCESKAASDSDAQQAFAQATAVYGYYAKQFFAQN